jgi:hypothetical protein
VRAFKFSFSLSRFDLDGRVSKFNLIFKFRCAFCPYLFLFGFEFISHKFYAVFRYFEFHVSAGHFESPLEKSLTEMALVFVYC